MKPNDFALHDKVTFLDFDQNVRSGEIRGINYLHAFVHYGPGRNDAVFIPWEIAERSFRLRKV